MPANIPALDPRSIPASFLTQVTKDPASAWPDAPPNFGRPVVPHIMTVSGRTSTRAYLWADEALRDSRANADRMRTDCGIMESVEARQRAVALLNWHIVPEDDTSHEQKTLADEVSRIIRRTRDFAKLRFSLGEARWFGRTGIALQYGKEYVNGHMRTLVKRWEPRHGDKLVFRYDDGTGDTDPDQVGIRVGGGYQYGGNEVLDITGQRRNKIEGTAHGLVYWLDAWERKLMIVNKHIIEDGPWEDPQRAGAIHGVGIRDRIYWTWYGMIECLADVLSYLERSAFGIEIWSYPAGNDQARARCEDAAKRVTSGGRTVLIVPRFQGEDADLFGVQHIEPGLGGIDAAMAVITDFFGHKIKRYILGQTLTSEAAATGLGSGVADAHMATFADIVKMDAVGDEETLTHDLVRNVQLWNFPKSRGIHLRFVIDTESPEAEKKMAGFKQAWDMGARIKEEDVLSMIGAAMPKATDKVLINPQIAQQARLGAQQFGDQVGGGGQDDLQYLFGPLAGLVGGQGGQGGSGEEQPPPGGGGPPGQPPDGPPTDQGPTAAGGEGPDQYAGNDADLEKFAQRLPRGGKKQPESSPGQKPMFEDVSTDRIGLWREELHPREPGGQFTFKGTGHIKSSPGQKRLSFSELASRIHATEEHADMIGPKRSQEIQQGLFRTLAESNATPEQVKALLSGDPHELATLKQIAEHTGQSDAPQAAEGMKSGAEFMQETERLRQHRDSMSAALDVPRDEARRVAISNRQRRQANQSMLPSQEQIDAEAAKTRQPAAAAPWEGRTAEEMAMSPMSKHSPEWYDGVRTSSGMTMHVTNNGDETYTAWKSFDKHPDGKVHVSGGKDAEMTMNNIWRGGLGLSPASPEMEHIIQAGMDREAAKAQQPELTPEDRQRLPEHLQGVNPAFPSEAAKLKGMAGVGARKAVPGGMEKIEAAQETMRNAIRGQHDSPRARADAIAAAREGVGAAMAEAHTGKPFVDVTPEEAAGQPDHSARAAEILKRIPAVSAAGMAKQLGVSEEEGARLLAAAKGGPAPARRSPDAGPTPAASFDQPFSLEQGKVTEGRPDPAPADPEKQGLLLDEMNDLPGQKRFFGGEGERAKVKQENSDMPARKGPKPPEDKSTGAPPPVHGSPNYWNDLRKWTGKEESRAKHWQQNPSGMWAWYDDAGNVQSGEWPAEHHGAEAHPDAAGLDEPEDEKHELFDQAKPKAAGRQETYINGDRGEYTGEMRDGMHVVEMKEGQSAGEEKLTARGPDGSDPYADRNKADWKEQQEGFRRLREAEAKPKAAEFDKPPTKPPSSWTKNEDGTYTAPNGAVWKKAAAGGEVSPVTGEHFAGGRLMPIHGLHEKPTVKAAKDQGGTASQAKPNENKERRPAQAMTPEQIAEEKERRENERKWGETKGGHVGELLGMGERPHYLKHTDGGTKRWEDMVESAKLTPDQVKELADHFQGKATEDVAAELDEKPHMLTDHSGKKMTKEEAVKGYHDNANLLMESGKAYWRKGRLATHPEMQRAQHYVSDYLGAKGKPQGERLHEFHQAIEKLKRGESLTGKAKAADFDQPADEEKPPRYRHFAPGEDQSQFDDEIREELGVSQQALDAYDPEKAVEKIGKKWSYNTLQGSSHPSMFDTRKEAVASATFHKQLKQDQFNNPSGYRDIVSVRAGKQLKRIEELMRGGMSEMEAGKQARQDIPDVPDAWRKKDREDQAAFEQEQAAAQPKAADFDKPLSEPPQVVGGAAPVKGRRQPAVEDFGEKIGGARKDAARALGKKAKAEKPDDSRPVWARRYSIGQTAKSTDKSEEGKWFISDAKDTNWHGTPRQHGPFETKEKAEAALPLLAVSRNHSVSTERSTGSDAQTYGIYRQTGPKKRALVKGGFASYEDAMKHMAANPTEIIEHKFPDWEDYSYLDEVSRTGKEHRQGDIKTTDFQKAFGFRGGEFGKWQMNKDGQTSLNHAYDALHDLSDVLNLPPKAMSLGGQLAIGFGSRGTGGKHSAKAHYESGKRAVINLTKMKGAGSLAHEWFHALDNYVAKKAEGKPDSESLLTSRGYIHQPATRPEITAAWKDLVDTMHFRSETKGIDPHQADKVLGLHKKNIEQGFERVEQMQRDDVRYNKRHKPFTPDQQAEWNALKEKVMGGDLGERTFIKGQSAFGGRDTFANLEAMNKLFKQSTGRQFHTSAEGNYGQQIANSVRQSQESKKKLDAANEGATETKKVHTNYVHEAKKLDNVRSDDYYTLPHEMAARAFAAYVQDKIEAKKNVSHYLTAKAHNKHYALIGAKPFPEAEERTAINEAFDKLFAAVKHEIKADEKGEHVHLYTAGRSDGEKE